MFLLIIFGLPLMHIAWTWWALARVGSMPHRRWWQSGIGAFASAMLACYASVIISRFTDGAWSPPTALLAATYIWFLIVLPISGLLAGAEALANLFASPEKRIPRKFAPPDGTRKFDSTRAAPANVTGAEASMMPPSRRELLAAGLAGAPPIFSLGAAGASLPRLTELRVRRIDIALPTLPRTLEGLTIAHVSDLHAGRFVGERLIRKVVDETNKLGADLVVFTGDLIDSSLADLPAGIDMLRRLAPRAGRFVCEGNHDLFENPRAFEQRMRSAEVGFLRDEAATVRCRGGLVQLLGMRWAGRVRGAVLPGDALTATLSQRDPDAFKILLAHHPHEFDRAAANGIPLTLSGHTHGGQLMMSEALGAGPLLFKYWSGLYRQKDAALVVSNGVGHWFPLRVHAPAEVIHITLRCA